VNLKHSNECPVCSGAMETVLDLPRFPMTELYEPYTAEYSPKGFVDQSFLFCPGCSHGKLGTIVPPEQLYTDYRTTTSKSIGASHSVDSFHTFIAERLDLCNYDVVIDIGANDSSLLAKFPDKRRIAVDPNASGDAECIREYVEKADLRALKKEKKLILCSHTLEHLEKPEVLLGKIDEILCYGDSCAFQFPSLDYLVKDARIDQIHHQHVHYFSLRSISMLMAKHGFEIVRYEFDAHHYGTLRIIFRRGLEELRGDPIRAQDITWANADFKCDAQGFSASVRRLRDPIGYGAALMVPVLRYYAPALDGLSGIMDADESKHGLRWINFNKPITALEDVYGRDVVITAFNTKLAVRKIAAKLFDRGARTVVAPFHAL
jgi:hypothetical protein